MLASADAARAVMGVMPSPRSGGGSISLLMGNRRDWFPGGRGIGMTPISAKTGSGLRPGNGV